MEPAKIVATLGDLPIGSRILFRSKKDWRSAVVTRKIDEIVAISVASPTGYNYRVKRSAEHIVDFDGNIPCLRSVEEDRWKENFSAYDVRW